MINGENCFISTQKALSKKALHQNQVRTTNPPIAPPTSNKDLARLVCESHEKINHFALKEFATRSSALLDLRSELMQVPFKAFLEEKPADNVALRKAFMWINDTGDSSYKVGESSVTQDMGSVHKLFHLLIGSYVNLDNDTSLGADGSDVSNTTG